MIAEENVSTIVSLCSKMGNDYFVERENEILNNLLGPKCTVDEKDMEACQYFPDNPAESVREDFGYTLNYQVDYQQLENENKYFTSRNLAFMYDLEDPENFEYKIYGDRTIKHLHFRKWASRSLPETKNEKGILIGLADQVSEVLITEHKQLKKGEIMTPSKICVHSKDGFGRTGTFIALVNAIMTIKE